jgi:hypothetical protein
MGKGIDLARAAGAGLHADVLDDFKDQFLVVLLKRLAKDGKVNIPMKEMDDTGNDLVSFSINEGVFNFVVSKKA